MNKYQFRFFNHFFTIADSTINGLVQGQMVPIEKKRNLSIMYDFAIMSDDSNKTSRKEIIGKLTDKYHLSYKAIEKIINIKEEENLVI